MNNEILKSMNKKDEIEKFIKKFNHSIKQQDKLNADELNLKRSHKNENTSPSINSYFYKSDNNTYKSNSNFNSTLSRVNLKQDSSNDKEVFFTTLKSLFAIFDQDCKGSIDLNELSQLGSNKNEILNDVISYLYRKNLNQSSKNALHELITSTEKLNHSSPFSNISNNNDTFSTKIIFHKTNKNIKAQSYQTTTPYYVSFDEFVQAAEIILDKRKLDKLKLHQMNQFKNNFNENCSNNNYNPNKSNQLNGATLSQAFDMVSNLEISANSCDIHNLIEKEHRLLKQGLNDLDKIRQFYFEKFKENNLKQQNIHRLKHQNLFSIDKLLTELKQLNDLNMNIESFLNTQLNNQSNDLENINIDSLNSIKDNLRYQNMLADKNKGVTETISKSPSYLNCNDKLPSYDDYIEHLNKTNSDLDCYLKEKQSRIDSLQKEKSSLIRRLFEMKSEAASLSKNTVFNLNNGKLNYEKLPLHSIQLQLANPQLTLSTYSSSTEASNDDFI